MNMAYDECALASRDLCLLRVYESKKEGVILGRFQRIDEEIDLKKCLDDEIELVRRISGGGTVFKVPTWEYNYSLVLSLDEFPAFHDVKKSYFIVLRVLLRTVNDLWKVNSEIYPGSTDIVLKSQKISGNSQARRGNRFLMHGTLLVKIDRTKMFRYIKMPRDKYLVRGFKEQSEFVTDLSSFSNSQVKFDDFADSFSENMAKLLNVERYYDNPSSKEIELSKGICALRYHNSTWLYSGKLEEIK